MNHILIMMMLPAIKKALNQNQISTYGKFTNIFEDKLKKYLGIKNLICLINGTSALHLAIKTLGIKKSRSFCITTNFYFNCQCY